MFTRASTNPGLIRGLGSASLTVHLITKRLLPIEPFLLCVRIMPLVEMVKQWSGRCHGIKKKSETLISLLAPGVDLRTPYNTDGSRREAI